MRMTWQGEGYPLAVDLYVALRMIGQSETETQARGCSRSDDDVSIAGVGTGRVDESRIRPGRQVSGLHLDRSELMEAVCISS